MSPAKQGGDPSSRRRRYLVHLLYLLDQETEMHRYVVRICPWPLRGKPHAIGERAFEDECEFIAIINPLLPPGSDVRDVFVQIESPTGFYYLLHLTAEEARRLGGNG